MIFAKTEHIEAIMNLYRKVVAHVNTTNIKLGWNTESYPDVSFVTAAVNAGQMCILEENGQVIAAGVVNHNVNSEYDDIDWAVKGPKEKVSTIHALATDPEYRGKATADRLLKDIEAYCRAQGDTAIHLDVIDTNIPAYKLYIRNGYTEVACIKMYYEVVGTREFWMMEKVL